MSGKKKKGGMYFLLAFGVFTGLSVTLLVLPPPQLNYFVLRTCFAFMAECCENRGEKKSQP